MPTTPAGRPPVRATADESAEAFAELRRILAAHAKGLKVNGDLRGP